MAQAWKKKGARRRKSLMFTTLMPWLLVGVWATLAVLIHVFKPQGGGM